MRIKCILFAITRIAITQRCFISSLVEFGQVLLEKKIFKFGSVSSMSRYYLLLKKAHCPSFEYICIPFTKGCLVLGLVEISQVVLDKKIKQEMFTTTTTNWQRINFDQKSLLQPSVQVC